MGTLSIKPTDHNVTLLAIFTSAMLHDSLVSTDRKNELFPNTLQSLRLHLELEGSCLILSPLSLRQHTHQHLAAHTVVNRNGMGHKYKENHKRCITLKAQRALLNGTLGFVTSKVKNELLSELEKYFNCLGKTPQSI